MKYLFGLLLLAPFFLAQATSVTVSGLSSGAYFANQFHVAFSALVQGSAILAGGPYNCANGDILRATNRCMKTYMGRPSAQESLRSAQESERTQRLDELAHLKTGRAYVLFGSNDQTVDPSVGRVLVEFYRLAGVDGERLKVEDQLPVGHAFPTRSFGNSCATPSKSPYLSDCDRDVAREFLQHLLGPLRAPVAAIESNFLRFDQFKTADVRDQSDKLSLGAYGLAYVPRACANTAQCPIHVSFHGCHQTLDEIGQVYARETGLNGWAEANGFIVVYPQAAASARIGNPNGCWDWWGYTDKKEYATKLGPQMLVIARIVEAFRAGTVDLRANR